ncbi:hypothetical protein [Sphaerisporangium album]|nr:hypothetical protein [Sphaerisporangium album]
MFPLDLSRFPGPPRGPYDDLVDAASRSVSVLVEELNKVVEPIIDQIEGS